MPVFAGEMIRNYHIGFDLILAGLHKATSIPIVNLYFQVLPVLLSFLVGLLVYKFVDKWQKSSKAAFWATFFVYFGGSFGWIVSLFRDGSWGGESMFWAMQPISTLINPPFALSLVAITSGLIFLAKYIEKNTKINFWLAVLFFGISIFIKVYAGLLVLTALLTAGIYSLITKRRLLIIKIFLASFAVSLLLYLPFNKLSADLIAWQPFWFLESMVGLPDRFNWQKMYSAMTTYRMGGVWLKAILAYGLVFAIFIVGNFGTRIIFLKALFKKPGNFLKLRETEVFIFVLMLAGIIVPILFVQKGTPWNTIQFLYYSLFFGGILAGTIIGEFRGKSKLNTYLIYIIEIAIILLTIPTTISSLGNYTPIFPQSNLPKNELEALTFLKSKPSGVVLTYPYAKSVSDGSPIPLPFYTTTAYVSAFSGKPVFLEDEMNLGIMQYSFGERRESVESFLNTLDEENAYRFLRDNNIAYVYWLDGQHARVGDKQLGLTKIFENEGVKIFKVN